jgi:hypothetical protein
MSIYHIAVTILIVICAFKGLLKCFEGYVLALSYHVFHYSMKCVSITRTVIGFTFLLAVDKRPHASLGVFPFPVRQRQQ